jgi:hypothetical protein
VAGIFDVIFNCAILHQPFALPEKTSKDLKKTIDKALRNALPDSIKASIKDGSWKDGGWAPGADNLLLANNVCG